MACTSQSALEYVKSARRHLVRRLKSLSVILENLYEQKVFSEEEVSKIQTQADDFDKKRKILDFVINKGEAACYTLLRIIDMTRQRTLERPAPLPENVDSGSPQNTFDLHHWISCFSFREDTEMDCKKKQENSSGVSPSELLKTNLTNILVVGKPGIGKTAVTHQMLKLWAESDNNKLDYMFYFDMRETSQITSAKNLEDLLFSAYSEPDEGKEEVLQDIKNNSENVTVIFNGLTDLQCSPVVQRLVEKDLLPDAKIVITCRPEVESEDLSDWASLRVEVKGFSEESIKAYLSKMLSAEHFISVLNNLELFTLCHVPMYALMVAACFSFKTSKDYQQPCTITEIYIDILRFCVQESHGMIKTRSLNHYIRKKCEEILSLAEVAFLGTQGKSVNLTAVQCEDSSVHSAFLKTLGDQVAPTQWRTSSAFLHYTVQEFFAGIWLLKNPEKMTEVYKSSTDLMILCIMRRVVSPLMIGASLCSSNSGELSFSVRGRWTPTSYLFMVEMSCTFQSWVKDSYLKEQ
uniref:NACHT domain-containing protein n=1 Tax=Myripristis murdjan TaxID=586833 RepID=A0A667XKU5_9TELE